jgi:hypothetical protein
MPNQGHNCYENYTYEGFVNKDNKIVLEGEKIKERKKIMHHASNMSSSLSCRSIIITIIPKIGSIWVSLSTFTATAW